jgi:hypothetical protein
VTVRTREIAGQIVADGKPLPLEIAIQHMRHLWTRKDDESQREAVQIALHIAPYFHPRLSSVSIDDLAPAHNAAVDPMAQQIPVRDLLPRPPKMTVIEGEIEKDGGNGSGNGAVR